MTEQLDLSTLENAINSLKEAIAVVSDDVWFKQQSSAVQHTLIAGVIQNFEFVYEISVKMLRRQLEKDAASLDEVDSYSFRDMMRTAGEKGLVRNVEAWFSYRTLRNITSHTYDHQKAQTVYQASYAFVFDAQDLLERINERNQ